MSVSQTQGQLVPTTYRVLENQIESHQLGSLGQVRPQYIAASSAQMAMVEWRIGDRDISEKLLDNFDLQLADLEKYARTLDSRVEVLHKSLSEIDETVLLSFKTTVSDRAADRKALRDMMKEGKSKQEIVDAMEKMKLARDFDKEDSTETEQNAEKTLNQLDKSFSLFVKSMNFAAENKDRRVQAFICGVFDAHLKSFELIEKRISLLQKQDELTLKQEIKQRKQKMAEERQYFEQALQAVQEEHKQENIKDTHNEKMKDLQIKEKVADYTHAEGMQKLNNEDSDNRRKIEVRQQEIAAGERTKHHEISAGVVKEIAKPKCSIM